MSIKTDRKNSLLKANVRQSEPNEKKKNTIKIQKNISTNFIMSELTRISPVNDRQVLQNEAIYV